MITDHYCEKDSEIVWDKEPCYFDGDACWFGTCGCGKRVFQRYSPVEEVEEEVEDL